MQSSNYLKYFTAIAIALSLQLSIQAQTKTDNSFDDPRQQSASAWEKAILTRSLESTTPVNAIKFSPDGQLLASVGASQITLWNINTGEIQRVLPGHYASDIKLEIAPTAIAFSPDSRFLATSTWSQGLLRPDQGIIVRDVTTGEVVLNLAESDGCRQVLYDISGEVIYGACSEGITAWSFPNGKKLFSFASPSVEAIAFSPDGTVIATVDSNVSGGQQGEQNNQIKLWQLNSAKPKLLKTLDGHVNDIAQLEFTPNGQQLVSSSYDSKIKIWNWQQGTVSRKTNDLYSNDGVFSLNANSQLIAGNFHSSTISSLVTGLPLKNTPKLGQKTSIMAFSPQNQILAGVNNQIDRNSLINLWSTDNSQPKKQPSIKDNYQVIPVNKYWINQEHKQTIQIAQPELDKPISIGKDPQAIALAGLGLKEVAESAQEVEVEYSTDDKLATVKITQTKLADDSVASRRYLVEFAPYAEETAEKWQIVWAGEQFKCRSGRGHQDWSSDLCL
jgi:WD40 repeat protein